MAKKMLINADMLLATPRRNDSIPQPVQVAPLIVEEKIQTPPSPKDSSRTVSHTPIERQEVVVPQIVKEVKKIIEITSVQRGLKPGETRATFIVKEEALEKIKAIAYWDRQNIKDIVQIAIDAYIKQYENAKGAVQPIP